MELRKKKLWKRIWWSCFMRDHLIVLGMGRPTRVKDGDYSVPMLAEADFEISRLPEHITVIPRECTLARDVEAQRDLAQMCIAKAKLCLCIGRILSLQYSGLVRCQGQQAEESTTRSSVLLFPKKLDETDGIQNCDLELNQWITELPASCQYSNKLGTGNSANSVFVNKVHAEFGLLHHALRITSTSGSSISRNHKARRQPGVSRYVEKKGASGFSRNHKHFARYARL